jgi:hypothetical protein
MMKKEFIVNRQGKDFVLYAGLLDQAHHEGLKRITTTLLQAPAPENGQMAICLAEVETEKGTFTGIGDASPDNVGRMIAVHAIRMAETRAKARALRDAINVGVTAVEELGEAEDVGGNTDANGRRTRSLTLPAQGAAHTVAEAKMTVAAPLEAAPAAEDRLPATPQQLDRLRKLQATLGRSHASDVDLNTTEAAAEIAELVRIFNAQSNAQSRGGARAAGR